MGHTFDTSSLALHGTYHISPPQSVFQTTHSATRTVHYNPTNATKNTQIFALALISNIGFCETDHFWFITDFLHRTLQKRYKK